MVRIRPETPADVPEIHVINELVFRQPAEADIVDALRLTCPNALSLVAEEDDRIVGHIFFSPAEIDTGDRIISGMGLAPLAVHPCHQRQGIGSRLVRAGLDILRARHCPFVIVLGHPEFYPQFDFVKASKYNLVCQWPGVPEEAFMVIELEHEALKDAAGVARYQDEFNAAIQSGQ